MDSLPPVDPWFDIILGQAGGQLGGRFSQLTPMSLNSPGAFSLMFSAFDERLKQEVAVKFLHPQAPEYRRASYMREAKVAEHLIGKDGLVQLVGALDGLDVTLMHPSVPTPVTFQLQYVAFERARESFGDLLIRYPKIPALVKRLDIVRDVVKGVNRMHNCGYCHRDLKPDNVLIFSGNVGKVGDYGTTRFHNGEDPIASPQDYVFPQGDTRYSAPEMFCSAAHFPEMFAGADWFAVGAILFEAVVNQNLYVAIGLKNPMEIARAVGAGTTLAAYLQRVETISGQYPIPAIEDFRAESWLSDSSPETLQAITRLVRALCHFNPRRRLKTFTSILHQVDIALILARRDHERSVARRRAVSKQGAEVV